MPHVDRFGRLSSLAVLLVSLSLVACGAGAQDAAPPSGPEGSESATPGPTATPEPTPSPDEALHAYLEDRDGYLWATFTGSYRSAELAGELTGYLYTTGPNFVILTESTADARRQPVERIEFRGQGFERQGEERWYATENVLVDGSVATLVELASWTEEVRSDWFTTEDIDLGALAAAIGALPADLTADSVREIEGDVQVEIGDGGELLAMEVELAITRQVGEVDETGDWSFQFAFEPDGERLSVWAPEVAWRREILDLMAYVEVPFDFEVQELTDFDGEMFFGPNGEEVGFAAFGADGLGPAENSQGFVDWLVSPEGFGTSLEVDEAIQVGAGATTIIVGGDGAPDERGPLDGRLVALHVSQDEEPLYYAAAMLQPADTFYLIHWFSLSDGVDARELELFKEILSTFVPLQ